MVAQAVDAAAEDFVAMFVKLAISWVVGDAVAAQFTNDDDPFLKKQGINFAAGMAVDKAMDEAIAQSGYDPEGALAAKVTASLDRMRTLLIDGDDPGRHYFALCTFRDGYPDEEVRTACRVAAEAMHVPANLGLRHRLRLLHDERSRRRAAVLFKSVFGTEAPSPAVTLDPETTSPRDQILQFAGQCLNLYGGQQP
jgi:hypothetical protein